MCEMGFIEQGFEDFSPFFTLRTSHFVKIKFNQKRGRIKRKRIKNGITLIALIITIIVMLILVTVTISAIKGDGLIGKSREAAFRTEMATVRENLNPNNFTIEGNGINLENFEPIPVEEANNWEISLKKELAYWGSFEYDVNKLTDDYIKKNFTNMISTTQEETVEDIYYIKSNNKKYIYNAQNDIIYKVKATRIYNNKIHSVEELDYILNGGSRTKRKNYTPISYEAEIVEVNGLKYYEPNLNGYTQENTSLVFYKVEDNTITDTTYEMPAKEWLEGGRQNTITREDGTYYLYDYSIKLWANIKIVNDTIETNWVWIPRYKLKNEETTTLITFIDLENNSLDKTIDSSTYTIPEAFTNNKKGIWISKYEPISVSRKQSTEFAYYIPNVDGFDKENTYLEIYDKQKDQFVKEEKLANVNSLSNFSKNNCWFDYDNNIWANIKIVKNNIETWWVWIPRYALKNEGTSTEIIFIDEDNNPIDGTTLPNGYIIPEAFTNNDKKGIWISKYEPVPVNSPYTINLKSANMPNVDGFDKENTYLEIYDEKSKSFVKEVKLSEINNLEEFVNRNLWYDYSKQIWANIKIVKNNVETWWVYIPRYAYRNENDLTDIILIDENNNPIDGSKFPSGYTIPEALKNNNKKGIWVSKYEPINN